MTPMQLKATIRVLMEVQAERIRQHKKWGEQNHPDFPKHSYTERSKIEAIENAEEAKRICEEHFANNDPNWVVILLEEIAESLAEQDNRAKLRAELIQVAAVAVGWIEKLDREDANEHTADQ